MRSYHHFTLSERESLRIFLGQGLPYREIARRLGRNASSISREIKRNGKKDGSINAWWSTSLYIYRRKKSRRHRRLLEEPELIAFVKEKLDQFWSPEIITVKWKEQHPQDKLSASTLYRGLKLKLLEGYSEQKHLRRRGKRKFVNAGNTGINPIKPEHLIDEWPEEIKNRARLGDWEGDTIRGKAGQGNLFTAIDRKSRYVKLELIPGKRSKDATEEAVCKALKNQLVNSLTLDNGTEFANHGKFSQRLQATVYFAHPSSPWERGSNENINGVLRFFFPKGCDFRTITREQLDQVETLLNNRPRKCLGWLSPIEFLASCCT